jgi:hypothetical protein
MRKCLTPFLVRGKGDGMFDQLRELLYLTTACCLQCYCYIDTPKLRFTWDESEADLSSDHLDGRTDSRSI